MKKILIKSRILVATAVILLLLASVFSCRSGADPTGSSAEAPETTAPGADSIKLVTNGTSGVRVVVSDKSKNTDKVSEIATKIKRTLSSLTSDDSVKVGTDWAPKGELDQDSIEILVGRTDYEQGREDMDALKAGSFLLKAYGNKIVLFAISDDGYEKARKTLNDLFSEYLVISEEGNNLEIPRDRLNLISVYNEDLANMPVPDGTRFSALYDSGENCNELIYEDADSDKYNSYIEALKAAGFKFYTSNSANGNLFTTLYNNKFTLNVGYYDYKKDIRTIMEPFYASTLPLLEADNKFTRVTTQQLSMLGIHTVTSDGISLENGMSILIRLTDGRFIVIDGGWDRNDTSTHLLNTIKSQYKEFASTGNPTIAAWIITHSHSDHNGLLNEKWDRFKNNGIKVEKVICNFLSKDEMLRSVAANKVNWDPTEGVDYYKTYNAARALGADLVVAHTGQVFWFADLKIEVLFTLEGFAPYPINAMNSTSLIMKMTFTDPETKKSTVYMSTGDATGAEFANLSMMYGDYLKCDVVQVAHHGMHTFEGDSGTISAYKLMLPPTVLFPTDMGNYNDVYKRGYNQQLIDKNKNKNYQETYIAGENGQVTTLPMPYTVGTAIKK